MFCYKNDLLPRTLVDYFNTGSDSHSHITGQLIIFAHTNARKFSVKVAGPNVWNNLPAEIINVPLFQLFKKRLRAYALTLYN